MKTILNSVNAALGVVTEDWMNTSFSFVKTVAAATLALFVWSSCIAQAAYGAMNMPVDPLSVRTTQMLSEFVLPYSLGRITDARCAAGATAPAVILIQDLHCNPEVQKNIAGILKSFDEKFGLSKVYLEGGIGALDTSWITTIADSGVRAEMVDTIMDSGRLTGGEYYSLTSGKYTLLAGLEDRGLFFDNIKRLGTIMNTRSELRALYPAIENDLAALKKMYYSTRNNRLDALLTRRADGSVQGDEYYRQLMWLAHKAEVPLSSYPEMSAFMRVKELQKKLNYKKVSTQIATYLSSLKSALSAESYRKLTALTQNETQLSELYVQLQRLSKEKGFALPKGTQALNIFLNFIEENQKINLVVLVAEEKDLIRDIRARFARTVAEQEIGFLSDFFVVAKNYLENKVSAQDYAYYTRTLPLFKSTWAVYAQDGALPALAQYYPLFDAFYAANAERNQRFLKNAFGNLSAVTPAPQGAADQRAVFDQLSNGVKPYAMITGGFHTQGLVNLLAAHGVSYIVVTPNVTRTTVASQKVYDELISAQAKQLPTQTLAAYILANQIQDNDMYPLVIAQAKLTGIAAFDTAYLQALVQKERAKNPEQTIEDFTAALNTELQHLSDRLNETNPSPVTFNLLAVEHVIKILPEGQATDGNKTTPALTTPKTLKTFWFLPRWFVQRFISWLWEAREVQAVVEELAGQFPGTMPFMEYVTPGTKFNAFVGDHLPAKTSENNLNENAKNLNRKVESALMGVAYPAAVAYNLVMNSPLFIGGKFTATVVSGIVQIVLHLRNNWFGKTALTTGVALKRISLLLSMWLAFTMVLAACAPNAMSEKIVRAVPQAYDTRIVTYDILDNPADVGVDKAEVTGEGRQIFLKSSIKIGQSVIVTLRANEAAMPPEAIAIRADEKAEWVFVNAGFQQTPATEIKLLITGPQTEFQWLWLKDPQKLWSVSAIEQGNVALSISQSAAGWQLTDLAGIAAVNPDSKNDQAIMTLTIPFSEKNLGLQEILQQAHGIKIGLQCANCPSDVKVTFVYQGGYTEIMQAVVVAPGNSIALNLVAGQTLQGVTITFPANGRLTGAVTTGTVELTKAVITGVPNPAKTVAATNPSVFDHTRYASVIQRGRSVPIQQAVSHRPLTDDGTYGVWLMNDQAHALAAAAMHCMDGLGEKEAFIALSMKFLDEQSKAMKEPMPQEAMALFEQKLRSQVMENGGLAFDSQLQALRWIIEHHIAWWYEEEGVKKGIDAILNLIESEALYSAKAIADYIAAAVAGNSSNLPPEIQQLVNAHKRSGTLPVLLWNLLVPAALHRYYTHNDATTRTFNLKLHMLNNFLAPAGRREESVFDDVAASVNILMEYQKNLPPAQQSSHALLKSNNQGNMILGDPFIAGERSSPVTANGDAKAWIAWRYLKDFQDAIYQEYNQPMENVSVEYMVSGKCTGVTIVSQGVTQSINFRAMGQHSSNSMIGPSNSWMEMLKEYVPQIYKQVMALKSAQRSLITGASLPEHISYRSLTAAVTYDKWRNHDDTQTVKTLAKMAMACNKGTDYEKSLAQISFISLSMTFLGSRRINGGERIPKVLVDVFEEKLTKQMKENGGLSFTETETATAEEQAIDWVIEHHIAWWYEQEALREGMDAVTKTIRNYFFLDSSKHMIALAVTFLTQAPHEIPGLDAVMPFYHQEGKWPVLLWDFLVPAALMQVYSRPADENRVQTTAMKLHMLNAFLSPVGRSKDSGIADVITSAETLYARKQAHNGDLNFFVAHPGLGDVSPSEAMPFDAIMNFEINYPTREYDLSEDAGYADAVMAFRYLQQFVREIQSRTGLETPVKFLFSRGRCTGIVVADAKGSEQVLRLSAGEKSTGLATVVKNIKDSERPLTTGKTHRENANDPWVSLLAKRLNWSESRVREVFVAPAMENSFFWVALEQYVQLWKIYGAEAVTFSYADGALKTDIKDDPVLTAFLTAFNAIIEAHDPISGASMSLPFAVWQVLHQTATLGMVQFDAKYNKQRQKLGSEVPADLKTIVKGTQGWFKQHLFDTHVIHNYIRTLLDGAHRLPEFGGIVQQVAQEGTVSKEAIAALRQAVLNHLDNPKVSEVERYRPEVVKVIMNDQMLSQILQGASRVYIGALAQLGTPEAALQAMYDEAERLFHAGTGFSSLPALSVSDLSAVFERELKRWGVDPKSLLKGDAAQGIVDAVAQNRAPARALVPTISGAVQYVMIPIGMPADNVEKSLADARALAEQGLDVVIIRDGINAPGFEKATKLSIGQTNQNVWHSEEYISGEGSLHTVYALAGNDAVLNATMNNFIAGRLQLSGISGRAPGLVISLADPFAQGRTGVRPEQWALMPHSPVWRTTITDSMDAFLLAAEQAYTLSGQLPLEQDAAACYHQPITSRQHIEDLLKNPASFWEIHSKKATVITLDLTKLPQEERNDKTWAFVRWYIIRVHEVGLSVVVCGSQKLLDGIVPSLNNTQISGYQLTDVSPETAIQQLEEFRNFMALQVKKDLNLSIRSTDGAVAAQARAYGIKTAAMWTLGQTVPDADIIIRDVEQDDAPEVSVEAARQQFAQVRARAQWVGGTAAFYARYGAAINKETPAADTVLSLWMQTIQGLLRDRAFSRGYAAGWKAFKKQNRRIVGSQIIREYRKAAFDLRSGNDEISGQARGLLEAALDTQFEFLADTVRPAAVKAAANALVDQGYIPNNHQSGFAFADELASDNLRAFDYKQFGKLVVPMVPDIKKDDLKRNIEQLLKDPNQVATLYAPTMAMIEQLIAETQSERDSRDAPSPRSIALQLQLYLLLLYGERRYVNTLDALAGDALNAMIAGVRATLQAA